MRRAATFSTGCYANENVVQIVTRRLIERGIIVLAKSTRPARMAKNLAIFDFAQDDDDKAAISALDGTYDTAPRYQGIARVKWLAGMNFNQ